MFTPAVIPASELETFLAADPHALVVLRAAQRRGIAVAGQRFYSPQNGQTKAWLQLNLPQQTFYYRQGRLSPALPNGDLGPHINGPALQITPNKQLTKDCLQAHGLAVPAGQLFGPADAEAALLYFQSRPGPVCLKPNRGSQGRGVFTQISTAESFAQVFALIASRSPEILVEDYFPGEGLRLVYMAPRVVAVKLGRSASVLGDGQHNVGQLLEAYNQLRVQRAIPGHAPLPPDSAVVQQLQIQGLDLNSVPAAGQQVLLRDASNGTVGAESWNCLDSTHPSYLDLGEAACRAIPGLVMAGLDVMTHNHRLPATPDNYRILEINSSPGLEVYGNPWEGPPQEIGDPLLDLLERLSDPLCDQTRYNVR
ncbi:MAG: hypothetical protein ACO1RX_19830 [Candidatus Sericytochromatia bacterium]